MRKEALLLVLLLTAACVKPGRRNAVWLVIRNETGRNLHNVSLDHGQGAFKYQLFTAGHTFGGWAKVAKTQALRLTFRDEAGSLQTPPLDRALTPDMIGGVFMVTLGPDGRVEQGFESRTGPPPGKFAWLADYTPWFAALLALLAIPPLVLMIRRAWGAAKKVPSKVKDFFANPALEAAATRLGLTHKVCPVRMFTNDPKDPTWWWEGKSEGHMLGVLDRGVIWIGAPDEATLVAFGREAPGGPFISRDFIENDSNPVLSDATIARLLAQLSPAVDSVVILGDAVEAGFTWKRAETEALASDVRVLTGLKARIESMDPPLARAVMRGDEPKALALIRSGAPLEARTIGCLNAMTAAAMAGRTELVKVLLAAGAKAQPEYGFPLHAAAYEGHVEVVKVLLDAGVPVNALDAPRDTPLIMAAQKGREEVVALLIARGADLNAQNTDRGTALGYARSEGHKRIVEMLRAAGAVSA